jgi:polyphosphate:AMP phosphotransferase
MFEVAELGLKLTKQEFEDKAPELHTRLLEIQQELKDSSKSAIIIVSGVEGAGKGEVVNRLNEWLDSRGIKTTAFWDETDEQSMRPRYWRYWQAMPARGNIGIMFGSWYTRPIIDRAFGNIDEAEYERQLQEIEQFERMLTDDGVIVIKLWFHLSRERVQKQLKKDAKSQHKGRIKRSPYTAAFEKQFEKFKKVSQTAIRYTDVGNAPWHIIEATDSLYRDINAGQIIHDSLKHVLAEAVKPKKKAAVVKKKPNTEIPRTILDAVDLTGTLAGDAYSKALKKWQARLQQLTWQARTEKRSVVLVFEGWDAAGKGSTIRRLTQAIDARLYQVISIAAPTDEEASHHYLWRFWRHIPLAGYMSIYDRSWYGRVLVERVEGFAPEDDWQRAYNEINLFEQQLTERGTIVIKFWLHLSPEEQLRRFKEREKTPWKMYKITEEDWRNRDKWNDYKLAINDMVARTSTEYAPWHLINSNDKKFARVDVIKTVCKTLKKALG